MEDSKRRMLIADDDKTLHDLYSELFSEEYDILEAFDGAEALMLAVEHRPHIMILDVMMPVLDGRTVCHRLKRCSSTKDIKIVMVTGKDGQHDRRLGFEIGADEYIEKPVYASYLVRSVNKLLQKKVAPHTPPHS